jgi:hypothetical protein
MVLSAGAVGVQGLLPLIPAEVSGVKLQEPITAWWNELFATPGNCEKCSLTVLYTTIEFMCLMAVPTVVGALLVLFAAFAPAAADMATALMEEKVGSAPRLASSNAARPRDPVPRKLQALPQTCERSRRVPTGFRWHSSGRRSRQRSRSPPLGQRSTSSFHSCCRWHPQSAPSARCCSPSSWPRSAAATSLKSPGPTPPQRRRLRPALRSRRRPRRTVMRRKIEERGDVTRPSHDVCVYNAVIQ